MSKRKKTEQDDQPDWTIHPGVHWREMIEEADYSQTWVAQHMGISTKHLSQICTGNAMPGVNATIAFAQLMDASPMLLWRLSCDHRLALALGKKDLTSEYV